MATVFGAAFVAGAVAAFGINRAVDVHVAQSRPQVECEPIFVALRSLPQGSAVTVWDVALRDWPKAMLPSTALRAEDSFEGMLLRYPLREGQPLVALQLVKAEDSRLPGNVAGGPAWPERPVPATEQHWSPARPMAAVAPPVEPSAAAVVDHGTVATETSAADPLPAPAADEEPESSAFVAVAAAPPASEAFSPVTAPADQSAEATPAVLDLPPVDATVATITDVVADLPPVEPTGSPTPAEPMPAAATRASVVPPPIAPPVPSSPATDIEMPLASITTVRPPAAARESSVLAGSESTTSTMPAATAPLRYLVVPERIALQADASFVSPQPLPGRSDAAPGRAASTPSRMNQRGPATPTRAGGPATTDGQRRPAAAPARQGAGRAEAAPKAGGWLPKLGFGGFGSGATPAPPAGPAAVR